MELNGKYNILLVDDEEGVRFTLDRCLRDAGYEVNTASGLSEAYAYLETNDFDIAIIDRMLTDGEDGLDLMRSIRKNSPFCQTILISAYPSVESAEEAARQGNFAYLIKPVRKADILTTVSAATRFAVQKKESALHDRIFLGG
jgi:DNA-binding NtrC family response regulator